MKKLLHLSIIMIGQCLCTFLDFSMFQKFKKYLEDKRLSKRRKSIIDLPNSNKVLIIRENKELTEVDNFHYLLDLFKDAKIKELYLNQNTNRSIQSFSPTIFETCAFMSNVKKCLVSYDRSFTLYLSRLPKTSKPSFTFFNQQMNEGDVFDDKSLHQLVQWMRDVLVFYENHKLSLEQSHTHLCDAIYGKLDVFYLFFYQLLCHIENVRCDGYESLAVYEESGY